MAEGHHETPDHSLPIYGHGSIAGRALTQGTQDYSGTSGGKPCKLLCTPEFPPLISNRRGRLPARCRHSRNTFTSRSGASYPNTPISTKDSAAHGSIGPGWIGSVM